MRPSRAFICILIGMMLVTPIRAQVSFPAARIDSVFQDVDRTDRPGCTLGVYRDGGITYARGYGMANLEYGIALAPRSVFHVASVSKQFAAFSVELLVSEGKVTWDDEIQTYVPELPDYGEPITLRHLVHHTSGVRDQWNLLSAAGWRWEGDLVTQQDALDIIARQQVLNFPPGDEYLYSNSGFTLLAAVVQHVTGQTLREFTTEHIFAPLAMTSTHFHDDHQMIVPDRAYGYRREDDGTWKISIPDFAIVGASSLFTTVEDFAKWDRNFREHLLGDDALFARLLTRGILNSGDTIGYAHGISVGTYRGQPTLGHGGADAGYRTQYLRFPDQDLGIAVFCNFAAAVPATYANRVADIVLEDVLAPAPVEPETRRIDLRRWGPTFERMAGFYKDPRTDIPVSIFLHEGEARLANGMARGDAGAPLIPQGGGQFQVGNTGQLIEVEMRDGAPAAISSSTGRRYSYVGRTPNTLDQGEYAGTYWSEELDTEYQIAADTTSATALLLYHRKFGWNTTRAGYPDAFYTGGDWFTFTRDASGRITGLTWSDGRVRRVRFERR